MKRRQVKYFRNDMKITIQGVGAPAYVTVGQELARNEVVGGGYVGGIEFEQGMLTIRKFDKYGKPHRDFGCTTLQGKRIDFKCDGVMVPAVRVTGILFDDIEDAEDATTAAPPAKPDCGKCGAPSNGKPLCPRCYELAKALGQGQKGK